MIDLSGLDRDDIKVTEVDGKGVCTKLGTGSDDERRELDRVKAELEKRAQPKLKELQRKAEASARRHYEGLLEAAGADDVVVTFQASPTSKS